jgi:hypothetical protein
MNLAKFILGLIVMAGAALAKYYQIQGWNLPQYFIYSLITLACLFLVLFLISFGSKSHQKSS